MAHLVKNLPAMWETWVRSLDWEDPLEKGKATHSRRQWRTEEPGMLQSMGLQRVRRDLVTEQHPVSGFKHGHLLRCHK